MRKRMLVSVLACGTFLMGTTEFLVAGLLPEIADSFSVSVAHAGLTITVFAVGMILGTPAMALLTLRLPRRTTLALSLAVFAAGHVVVAMTTMFSVLLAARFVTAVATGAFWAVAAVAAAEAVGPAHSSRALAVVLGGGMLANVLGVPLGAFSGLMFGWRGPFLALALLALTCAAAVLRVVPGGAERGADSSVRAAIRALWSARLWLTLAICAAVNASVLSVYSFVSPLLTQAVGLPTSMVPVVLVMFGTAALVGSLIGGRLGDRRPFRVLMVTAGGTLLATAGLCLTTTPWTVLLLLMLLGFAGLSANPILVGLVVRYGHIAPTLPSAMATAVFNIGTAAGTIITESLLVSPVALVAPSVTGAGFGLLAFIPLGVLILLESPSRRRHARRSGA